MTKQLSPLALDPGASKLLAYGPDSAWAFQSSHVAPALGNGLAGGDGLSAPSARPMKISAVNVPPLYVGDLAHRWGTPMSNNDFDRFGGAPEMRALFYAVLTQYTVAHGPLTAPLHLGVALPNEFLGTASETEKQRVRDWLLGVHIWDADWQALDANGEARLRVEVGAVSIMAQAVATLFDYTLDDSGRLIPERKAATKGTIGIVNIGHRTVELTAVENGERLPRFTTGASIGAANLLRLYDPHGHAEVAELEPRLRSGRLDVADFLPLWERQPARLVDETWGNAWRRWSVVVVAGGGVLLLPTFADRFNGKAFVPPMPAHAVARGAYKSLLAKLRRS